MMHTLTADQKQIARQAFAHAAKHSETLALLFYAKLFELDPGLRPLFKPDMEEQGHRLITMLELCMEGLDDRAELAFALRNLGARHVEYGVKLQDYETVQYTLMWTMREGLGAEWNAETESALSAVFGLFLHEMQVGAASVAQENATESPANSL